MASPGVGAVGSGVSPATIRGRMALASLGSTLTIRFKPPTGFSTYESIQDSLFWGVNLQGGVG